MTIAERSSEKVKADDRFEGILKSIFEGDIKSILDDNIKSILKDSFESRLEGEFKDKSESWVKGWVKGWIIGFFEKRLSIAEKLIENGIEIKDVTEITRLTELQIDKLKLFSKA